MTTVERTPVKVSLPGPTAGDSFRPVGVGDKVVRIYKRWRTVGVVEEVGGTSRPSLRVRFEGQADLETYRGYGTHLGQRESDLGPGKQPHRAANLAFYDEAAERELARRSEAERRCEADYSALLGVKWGVLARERPALAAEVLALVADYRDDASTLRLELNLRDVVWRATVGALSIGDFAARAVRHGVGYEVITGGIVLVGLRRQLDALLAEWIDVSSTRAEILTAAVLPAPTVR